MNPPLPLPGYLWRPLSVDDAAGLARLAAVCASLDGNPYPATQAVYAARLAAAEPALATDALCAATADGTLAAFAWVTFDGTFGHEFRVYLDGRVRPEFRRRGLGRALLTWSEEHSRGVPATQANGRPVILRIDTYDERNPSAGVLFARLGFRLALAEADMRRDLAQPIPPVDLPAGYRFVTWEPAYAGQFYTAYVDAFRARLGPRTPPSEEEWRCHYTTFPSFRAELSPLLLEGDRPIAYALCSLEDSETEAGLREGWIVQMGVRPAWQRRGLGGLVLAWAMHKFRDAGLFVAMLNVNVDNPAAASVYRRQGFVRTRLLSSYRQDSSLR